MFKRVPTQHRRPIWYIYSGMGTQWMGMGRALMQIEQFRNSIFCCVAALKPYGFNVYEVLMNASETTFQSPLNSAVCVIAIQVLF